MQLRTAFFAAMSKQKIHHLLLKAEKARGKKDFPECKRLCQSVLRQVPSEMAAAEIWGLCALEVGQFFEAIEPAQLLMDHEPKNPNGAMIASVALMNTGQDEVAIQVLEHQLEKSPEVLGLWFNLHSAYSAIGDTQKSLEIALKAVTLAPTNADAYNNLGASLHACARNKDAVIAFQTAVDLNPRQFTARLNLANSLSDDDERVIQEIEYVLKEGGDSLTERARVGGLHNSAFAYLRLGILRTGWERLEYGFSPLIESNRGRKPRRNFDQPRWKGEALAGRRLLVWREQGIGDEIMFATMLHELENLDGQVILECEPRLVEVFKRCFPKFEVRSELYRGVYPFDSAYKDFDLQIPIGSLAGIFRNDIADFDRSKPYWVVDPELKEKYAKRLMAEAPGKRWVGLCWRSAIVSPTRSTSYTLLGDWLELLRHPDVAVVNLQYGQCEDELSAMESEWGIRIHRWSDTNLQDDFSALSAIIANLHSVCSVGTTVAQVAGAMGAQTYLVATSCNWTSFGTTRYPFHPSIELMISKDKEDIRLAVHDAILRATGS